MLWGAEGGIEMLVIRPIHLRAANEYVKAYHRHNIPTAGGKFAIQCLEDNRPCGVAICGRPISRNLDDNLTLEIYRNCTDGTRNACSKLYGACVNIARHMGYARVITYTLASESGASLKASNFLKAAEVSGEKWHGVRAKDYYISPEITKYRWECVLREDNDNGEN